MFKITYTAGTGTITFTSETDADFQAEVLITGAAALNVRTEWQIVMTFSDPIANIRNVSFKISNSLVEFLYLI